MIIFFIPFYIDESDGQLLVAVRLALALFKQGEACFLGHEALEHTQLVAENCKHRRMQNHRLQGAHT